MQNLCCTITSRNLKSGCDISMNDRKAIDALYINFPFCKTPCSYCHYKKNLSFGNDCIPDEYFSTVLRQTEALLEEHVDDVIGSIYFGGGTPSLLNDAQCNRFKELFARHNVRPFETTIEVHPGVRNFSLDNDFFNRYSIGVQSFDEKTLAAYNRKNYTVSDVYDLVERLRKRGKAVINIDLVFDEELSEADIESVNELQPETVTLYPNTQGRGSRRLLSVLKTLESAKDRLKNYRPLGSSKFIFVRNDSRQSLYSQTEYELLGNIYGIGHNSVSYVGDTSYLCRYSDGAYELKERHRALNRRFEYLMMGLPSGVKNFLWQYRIR